MSSNIIELFGKMDTDQEKLDFMTAQFEVITSLNKQVDQLKIEKRHLEQLLKDAVPVINILPTKEQETLTEEQRICKEQLVLLKSFSQGRELTMEEARKVEIYSKILFQTQDKNKKSKSQVDDLPIADLLKIVKDE